MVDTSNPMLQLGLMGMMQPNRFSQFQGRFPMPGFRGAPTDASGMPISPSAGASTDPTQAYLDALSNPGRVMTPGVVVGGPGGNVSQGMPTGITAPVQGGFIPGPAAAPSPAAQPTTQSDPNVWDPAKWQQLISGAFAGPSKGGMAGMGLEQPPTWPGTTLNSVPGG